MVYIIPSCATAQDTLNRHQGWACPAAKEERPIGEREDRLGLSDRQPIG